MSFTFLIAALLASAPQTAPAPHAMPGEDAVDPYAVTDANAGARQFSGDGMANAFRGQDGIRRIVASFVARNYDDPEIGDIFKGQDRVRLTRTLFEQFCYILNAGCSYSGRDMASSHKDLGIQQADMNRLVRNLQASMADEGVPFPAQNRFLSKLAPMRKDVVVR
jgi:hemoglobin